MRAVARILVVIHPRDPFATRPYLAAALAARWRARGHAVTVQAGWAQRPDADLVLPHLDMTVWPDAFLRFLEAYPRVLNRRAGDIRKRVVSALLVDRGDAWDGPVMVKTDANHAGIPERAARAPAPAGGWLARLREAPDAWLARARDRDRRALAARRYPVFATKAQVPAWVWRDPALVVERFLPVYDGTQTITDDYWVLGRAVVHRRLWNAAPLVPAGDHFHYSEAGGVAKSECAILAALPPALARYRAAFGLDFGKLDVLRHDGAGADGAGDEGRHVVIDVAHTPASPTFVRQDALIDALARGLDDHLADAAPASSADRRPRANAGGQGLPRSRAATASQSQ